MSSSGIIATSNPGPVGLLTGPPASDSVPGPGGALPEIPLSEPVLAGNEWKYVKECIDSGWISSVGQFVNRFEQEFARVTGSRYAVAMASGTAALHVALRIVGVRAGDEVLMPSLTFIAPANAVRYCGGHPVFFDCEPHFWQIDAVQVAGFLRRWCIRRDGQLFNRLTGRRVAAMLPVHILGHPAELHTLVPLATEFGIPLIEDATESLGASYHGRPVGAFGLLGCFSFNGNKLLTTGGGGMLVTDDESLAAMARYLSTQAKDDPIEYVHHAVGYNYRLTNVQAAIGCAQLERLPELLKCRRLIAERYRKELAALPCDFLGEAPGVRSAFWLSTLRTRGQFSRSLMRHLHGQKILARPLWQPLHQSPAHAADRPPWACPVSEALYGEVLSVPSSASLTEEQQSRVVGAVRSYLKS